MTKTRSEIIDALSWAEDEERGRWGVEYATEVLEAHEESIRAEYGDDDEPYVSPVSGQLEH